MNWLKRSINYWSIMLKKDLCRSDEGEAMVGWIFGFIKELQYMPLISSLSSYQLLHLHLQHNYNKRLEISAMRMSWSLISPLLFFLKETSYNLRLEQKKKKKKPPSAVVALNPHATTKNLKTTCGPPVHRSCVTTTWSLSSPTPKSTPIMLQRHCASIQRGWGFFYKKPRQFSCSL